MCHISCVICQVLRVTCHRSLMPTATATDPPPANSLNMHRIENCLLDRKYQHYALQPEVHQEVGFPDGDIQKLCFPHACMGSDESQPYLLCCAVQCSSPHKIFTTIRGDGTKSFRSVGSSASCWRDPPYCRSQKQSHPFSFSSLSTKPRLSAHHWVLGSSVCYSLTSLKLARHHLTLYHYFLLLLLDIDPETVSQRNTNNESPIAGVPWRCKRTASYIYTNHVIIMQQKQDCPSSIYPSVCPYVWLRLNLLLKVKILLLPCYLRLWDPSWIGKSY